MKRLIKLGVTAYIAMPAMTAIKGYPLNETGIDLRPKTMSTGADETATTVKDLNSKKLEPPETFKNATEARNILKQASEDQLEPETN
jgi:hypothetical protein